MTTVLDGAAIEAVASLTRQADDPKIITVGDYEFSTGHSALVRVDTDRKLPGTREFYTLSGFAGFLVAEKLAAVVHVMAPTMVEAISSLHGVDKHLRATYARAVCKTATTLGFRFNEIMALERLNIALQTCFEPGIGDIDDLRHFCASVRSSEEIGVADDGVSQTVQAKSGIAAVQTTGVRNPWELAPWRTFSEVSQPQAPFVLRFERDGDGPTAGLFETGDQRWQVEAIKSIATFLTGQTGLTVQVVG
jgi:hypothetical protein